MIALLPWPPSINHYWRHVGKMTLISSEGRKYRKAVVGSGAPHELEGRLAMLILIAPPDRRRRDVDNIQKPLLDALEHAGAYGNDGNIDLLITDRDEVVKGGCVVVCVEELPARGNEGAWLDRMLGQARRVAEKRRRREE